MINQKEGIRTRLIWAKDESMTKKIAAWTLKEKMATARKDNIDFLHESISN